MRNPVGDLDEGDWPLWFPEGHIHQEAMDPSAARTNQAFAALEQHIIRSLLKGR